jgi:hypothetical protein
VVFLVLQIFSFLQQRPDDTKKEAMVGLFFIGNPSISYSWMVISEKE